MIAFPDIDPVAFSLGPIAVRWYGISYVVGILLAWYLLHRRAKRSDSLWTTEQVGDLVFFAAMGGVLGGRFGYALFYNFSEYLAEPLAIFKVWQGGMSFHGGLLGLLIAAWWFSRRVQRPYAEVLDTLAPVGPLALLFGRVANFINAELWGAPTQLPWGVVFPHDTVARHPSQLYEAFLEGLVLFVVLWWVSAKPRTAPLLSGLFLVGYGTFRFMIEFVREPDRHIGYLAFDWLTMGQVLSVPMVVAGGYLLFLARRNHNVATGRTG